MNIRSATACAAYSYLNATGNRSQARTGNTAKFSAYLVMSPDKVSISQAARNAQAGRNETTAGSGGGATEVFAIKKGPVELDFEDYFSSDGNTDGTPISLETLAPLLLPTKDNIEALTNHISSVFPGFLAANNIPEAPETITYDSRGQIQLPADYEYAEELKQALEDNPAMEKELRTVNALSSHYAAMQKSLEFQREYRAAATQAEIDAVLAKYSYLFGGNQTNSSIALHFSKTGALNITADDEALI